MGHCVLYNLMVELLYNIHFISYLSNMVRVLYKKGTNGPSNPAYTHISEKGISLIS